MFAHKTLCLVLLILLFFLTANAQEAYKLEDVTRLRCDIGEIPQIDNFLIEVQEKKGEGILVVYGLEGVSKRFFRDLRASSRMSSKSFNLKISMLYGGYSNKPKMEIWVIPQSAKKPEINFDEMIAFINGERNADYLLVESV